MTLTNSNTMGFFNEIQEFEEFETQDKKIINFPSSSSSSSSSATELLIPPSLIDQLYKRLIEDMTNQIIQENTEGSFDPIYFCDLQPDQLYDSIEILKTFALGIEDRSHLVSFDEEI